MIRLPAVRSLGLIVLLGAAFALSGSVASAQTPRIWTDKGSYQVGEAVRICFTVPRAGQVRITATLPDGSSRVLLSGVDDGRGDCLQSQAGTPPGARRLVLEYPGGRTETTFTVAGAPSQPAQPPQATPAPIAGVCPVGVPSACNAPAFSGPQPTSPPSGPTQAARFQGTAKINGDWAPGASEVLAFIGATVCGRGGVDVSARYIVMVAAAGSQAGCGTSGATVSFALNGMPAAQTATFQPGGFTVLNLTAGQAPQPTPPPADLRAGDVTLAPDAGVPGATVTATGFGWPGARTIRAWWDGRQQLTSTRSDAAGGFAVALTIPTDATPGSHHLLFDVEGADALYVRKPFEVRVPATPSPSPTPSLRLPEFGCIGPNCSRTPAPDPSPDAEGPSARLPHVVRMSGGDGDRLVTAYVDDDNPQAARLRIANRYSLTMEVMPWSGGVRFRTDNSPWANTGLLFPSGIIDTSESKWIAEWPGGASNPAPPTLEFNCEITWRAALIDVLLLVMPADELDEAQDAIIKSLLDNFFDVNSIIQERMPHFQKAFEAAKAKDFWRFTFELSQSLTRETWQWLEIARNLSLDIHMDAMLHFALHVPDMIAQLWDMLQIADFGPEKVEFGIRR